MTYEFLADNNCTALASFIPGCATLRSVNIPEDAADDDIFQFASDRELTIVTQNDRHFTALMRHAMHTSGRKNCAGEGWGLIVPNSLMRFDFVDVTRRLHFKGKRIDWDDVGIFNLRVSLSAANDPVVTTLPRCKHCVAGSMEDWGARYRELGIDA